MNYFLTRRHYTRVAVVPPRCFAEKLARTACLALCHGTFSLLLATPPPPLTERALFMSRQASGSRRASLPASPSTAFSLSACSTSRSTNSYTQRQARRSVRDTVSLTLLRYTVSFPSIARWNRNRRTREAQPTFSSLLFSSLLFWFSVCSSVSPVPRNMEARTHWINLSTVQRISLNEIAC